MIWLLKYKQIKRKKNKSLVQCIDQFMDVKMHDITEISNSITYILSLVFVWSLEDEYNVVSITTYTNQTVA